MESMTRRHLTKALQNFAINAPHYIKIKLVNDSLTDIRVLFTVFEGCLFEKGYFELEFKASNNYPLSPPRLVMLTPIYHPNILYNGKICIDILDKEEWTPALTLFPLLISIHSILQEPDFSNPCNIEFENDWKENESNCRKQIFQTLAILNLKMIGKKMKVIAEKNPMRLANFVPIQYLLDGKVSL
ncbi:hypothetical protein SteCoe_26047 [Stentor coeruleus]|uniref:UBC core domain-containing protein n=1 Tax=Stentor coeruleus TaxID=5963 RepID=A0A1R2BE83_9CILI|nr:hypothetical protein SteCoe_26047 [Stentor coeruleus]